MWIYEVPVLNDMDHLSSHYTFTLRCGFQLKSNLAIELEVNPLTIYEIITLD